MQSNKLRGRMAEMGYTITSFAAKLGVCRYTLRRKLNGETEFTLTEVKKIRDILRFSPQEVYDIFLRGE